MKELKAETGAFSAGQAESEAAVNAQEGVHDAALWAERAAKLAVSSAASVARVKASGGGQA